MPTVTVSRITGYKTCARKRVKGQLCPGYESHPAELDEEEVAWTFLELGGDMPGVERSQIHHRAATPGVDDACDFCGGPVNLSAEPRPLYENISGVDPDEILYKSERERLLTEAAQRQASAAEQSNALKLREIEALEESNRLRALELERQPARKPKPSAS